MADSDYTSNLQNYDPEGNYPSAASPLDLEELLKTRAVTGPPPSSWTPWPQPQQAPASANAPARQAETANSPALRSVAAGSGVSGVRGASRAAGDSNSASAANPATPDYSGLALGQLQRGEEDLTAAEQAAQAPPPNSPQLDALDQQIAQASVPTQLRQNRPAGDTGVGTGEMLAAYKPSIGQRIWRGVRSGLEGLAIGSVPGALVGAIEPQAMPGGRAYGAPNARYEQTEADRQETLKNLEAQRPAMSDALKNAITARRQQVEDLTKLGGERSTAARETTGIQTSANETPEAKAAAAQKEQETRDATQFNDRQQRWNTVQALVPPSQRSAAQAHYLLTGELPQEREPRQPSAEEIMVARGINLWQQANPGKKLDFNSYVGILGAVRGRSGDSDETADSIVNEATGKKQEFADDYTRIEPNTAAAGQKNERAGWYLKNGAEWADARGDDLLSPQAFNDRIDQYRKDANAKLARYGVQINAQGQVEQQSSGNAAPENLKGPIRAGETTAKGPDGHRIVARGGQWVDPTTGLPPTRR